MPEQFDSAWEMPVGVDVSKHQGDIDWRKLAKSGVSFAYIKATEGYGYRDPRLKENFYGARKAGIIPGLYHFARADSRHEEGIAADALAESECFVRAHRSLGLSEHGVLMPGVLPPALDIEWGGAKGVNKGDVTKWCHTFLTHLWFSLGAKPIIYTGPNFAKFKLEFEDEVPFELGDYPLWMARYNKGDAPSKQIKGWPPLIWQHSGSWPRPDRDGKIDANRFYGSKEDLYEFSGLPRDGKPYKQPMFLTIMESILRRLGTK